MKYSKLALTVGLVLAGGQYASAENLEVYRVIEENTSEYAVPCVTMSDIIADQKAFKSQVSILNKKTGKNVTPVPVFNDRTVCFSELDFGTEYQITLKKGIKGSNDFVLGADKILNFTTSDRGETVKFLPGNIISADMQKDAVTIETVNFNKFRVSLFRISSEDLAGYQSKATGEFDDKYDSLYYVSDHGIFVGSKTFDVKGSDNEKKFTTVDLSSFGGKIGPGLYALVLTDDNETFACDSTSNCLTQLQDEFSSMALVKSVVVTDLGVSTYKDESGISVAVRSITNATSISDAKVQLISAANEVLKTVTTDNNGYASFGPEVTRGTKAMQPVLVKVTKGDDFYYLDLRRSSIFIDEQMGVSDRLNNSYKVYSYTNRNLVRPGESVYYQALVRDKQYNAADLKAVKLMIYRPDGVLEKQVTLSEPKSGGFGYEFEFDKNANLGAWKFELGFDKNNLIASTTVVVDNFLPSTIKPTISIAKPFLGATDPITAHTQYIYDAPAANINVSGSYYVMPDNHPVEKYKDYYFGPEERKINEYRSYSEISSNVTDNSGNLNLVLEEVQEHNFAQKVKLTLGFMDPNSKIIKTAKEFKLAYNKPMIGVKEGFDKNDSHISDFGVIISDQNGQLSSGKVSYSVYKRSVSYQYVFEKGHWSYITNEYLTPVTAGNLDVSADEKTKFAYKFDSGMYVAKFMIDDQETSLDFYVGSVSDIDPNKPDRIEIASDKKIYKKGETAVLEFESSFDGYADLYLDNALQNKMRHYRVSKGHNSFKIELDKDLQKGTYAVVSTYASEKSKQLGILRAIGVTYLDIDTSDRTLQISGDIPETVKPNSSVDIRIKVENADDNTYVTGSFVDEGILMINKQKSPSPDKTLFGRGLFTTEIHDVYSYIMKSLKNNGQGYGADGEDEANGGINPTSLSTITKNLLSHYTPAVKVVDGYATLHYDLKDLSSTARLMVSAWSKDKLGSFEKNIGVKDIAVSKVNLPQFFHDGDVINGNFTIDNLNTKDNKFSYTLKCTGNIICDVSGDISVPANRFTSVPIKVTAKGVGVGNIDIKVKGNDYSFETVKEYSVLTPYSRVTESKMVSVKPSGQRNVKFSNEFQNGTSATIVTGKVPYVDIDKLTNGILNEQSYTLQAKVSDGLSILAVLTGLEKNKSTDQERIKTLQKYVSDRVAMIQSMIGPYGLMNYVFNSYDEHKYTIAYAALFLHKADKAGFNVNKNILNILKNQLMNIQVERPIGTNTALAMYVLASMGVNVKSNLVYQFDHNTDNISEIESMAYFARTFGLYGDTNRQQRALDIGRQLLNEVLDLYNVNTDNYDDRQWTSHIAKILNYVPYQNNTVVHDTAAIISAMIEAKKLDNIEKLYGMLNSDISTQAGTRYELLNIAMSNQEKGKVEESVIANNSVNVSNPKPESVFAMVSADGYVVKGAAAPSGTTYKQYYYSNDKIVGGPITLNVNEDILVVGQVIFPRPYSGNVVIEVKVPANTIFVEMLNYNDIHGKYKFLNFNSIDGNNYVRGDSDVVITDSLYNRKIYTYAYVLRGAHKGNSVPLMSSGFIKTGISERFSALDPNRVIIVK